MSDTSSESFEEDVLVELGDDGLQEIATLLGTDTDGARSVVGTTASTLSAPLQEEAAAQAPAPAPDPPLQGVATLGGGLGGLLGGGMMAGVLAKVAKPVATAVSKKTGVPVATVTRVIELLIPVVLAVLSKRAGRTPPRTS
ncbi:DUF937 domain-containing protein [Streptomyces spectabilis]|uniref:DUF937 domain-containing protein n=1 Tax=Streptomyces spectabilis TaxID=68270 RepID=A0A5P2X8R6_STRST|nr:DUF937 domain-containing protein [Streptomyces spectabilis]MBB5106213.1 hypothetical protein [Streptomyces spectabilis]MCI3902826.1 DUF937 domain-containing protein [Streptomyces spectabilis]QEV60114.1 hypothetical protein CP982_16370 [Streptomyces spectabilis]GGV34077.1 hypothetical protein GCM10010245_55020 [Streptomyces spectabilis]